MSQSVAGNEPRVRPAQVSFLAIYNPILGTSDETLRDQLVYYYARRGRKRHDKNGTSRHGTTEVDEAENERLRQIGLAQGMVSFANNFSSSSNVDSIETEKSRIILHELEKNWWVLASIDLTRLPTSRTSREDASAGEVDYSAREVAPVQLLIAQLVQANSLFLIHHATKLQELFERAGRDNFCGLLERYWNKFLQGWDVLLHGNPAVEIYNATKLGGGGELGIGVGEEEWGSGEREVLEGFVDRTTGLRDLIVGRYGLSPGTERASNIQDPTNDVDEWLGAGNDTAAADGIIFSGKGLVSKRSLSTLSQWMETIFKYGDDAYGVGNNPSSRPRASRRKRQKVSGSISSESSVSSAGQEPHPVLKPPKKRAPNLRKQAMENNASPPGIPAPLVGQVERSLDQALAGASARASSKSPGREKTQKESMTTGSSDQDSSTFGADNMMKYLTLGYGKSWTLNPKGLKPDNNETRQKSPAPANQEDGASATSSEEQGLQEVDPTPEVSEEEKPFQQKLEQSIGKFLIGLSGDLEQTELDVESEHDSENSEPRPASKDNRLFLRTLTIEMRQPENQKRNATIRSNSAGSVETIASTASAHNKPPTSAEASVDGPQPNITHEKVQIAIYVHQPFMFLFLFELHTLNLTMPSFYRSIHNQLGPLQKPLLRSTDPNRIAQRIATAMGEKCSVTNSSSPQTGNPIYDLVYDPIKHTVRTSIPNIPIPGSLAAEGLTPNAASALSVSGSWYTLGIPIGSPSPTTSTNRHSNRLVKSAWSRTEALNAHTQILNTYLSTRSTVELEHSAKTSRGWWVLWMKISSRSQARNKNPANEEDKTPTTNELASKNSNHKEAFLVRKAADFKSGPPPTSRTVSTGPGRWLLREQKRDVSGASSIGSAASAKGVSEGVGVDAKKWVEGLLSLTQ